MEYEYTSVERHLAEWHLKDHEAREHLVNWRGVCEKCGGKFQRRGTISHLVYIEVGGRFYHVTCAPKEASDGE